MAKIETHIILPDIHTPYHDRRCLKAVDALIADLKPGWIHYLGDQCDLKMVRDILDGKGCDPQDDNIEIKENYDCFRAILDRHHELSPRSKMQFFEGNHEERIQRLFEKYPAFRESNLDIEQYFQFEKRKILFVPYAKDNHPGIVRIGKLHLMHGQYYSKYHAEKTVAAYKRNIMYCHSHDMQSHPDISPLDVHDVHIAQSIGCLCNRNPFYRINRPNRWVHGFAVVYVLPNGNFHDYPIRIVSGKFVFGGQVYG